MSFDSPLSNLFLGKKKSLNQERLKDVTFNGRYLEKTPVGYAGTLKKYLLSSVLIGCFFLVYFSF
ncbi:hypothetical protein LM13656_240094 [Listeria monocytogenes]|nr:hypothetical protein LM1000505_220066 [Listeria monocytogenes]CUK38403.1 hypothetical protein LM13656_240094 [Listeria monocytogenes]CUK54828.1 hypothetical protein LM600444_140034 [Listeria monocytogenes]CUK66187.1 hypothetical protein LM600918_50024 [Listeria monocytogenes]CUK96458.1 hypothetical protein LM701042_140034 [Listeria monocytogenes]